MEDNGRGQVLPSKVKGANSVNTEREAQRKAGSIVSFVRNVHGSHGSNSVQGKWVWDGNK